MGETEPGFPLLGSEDRQQVLVLFVCTYACFVLFTVETRLPYVK